MPRTLIVRSMGRAGIVPLLIACVPLAAERSRPVSKLPPSGGAAYAVEYIPGGIDRVLLTKTDTARNRCIQVTLASPGLEGIEVPRGKVDLPPGWTVERAFLVKDARACSSRWPKDAINASEVNGVVRWGPSPTEQTEVDLRLSFRPGGKQAEFSEKLAFKR